MTSTLSSSQYGAVELKGLGRVNMVKAALLASLTVCCLTYGVRILTELGTGVSHPMLTAVTIFAVLPPPLDPRALEAYTPPGGTPRVPDVGIPVPVPDRVAPPENLLPSIEDINRTAPPTPRIGNGVIAIPATPQPESVKAQIPYIYYDEPPKVLIAVKPVYPDIARQSGVEGKVSIKVQVGRDGRVLRAEVLSGSPLLCQAALDAALRFRFLPALANDQPVEVWIAIPFSFRLNGE